MSVSSWPRWPPHVVRRLQNELGWRAHDRLAQFYVEAVRAETPAVRLRVLQDLGTLQTCSTDGHARWWGMSSGSPDHARDGPHELSRRIMEQMSTESFDAPRS